MSGEERLRFMRMAIDKAREGVLAGQTPFGACIVKGGEVVACEHNRVWEKTDITAHAEVTAIRAACARLGAISLDGCVIYSTTEPCPMCFSAIHWAGIREIVYGASIADAARFGFRELEISNDLMCSMGKSAIKVRAGVLAKEAVGLFEEWAGRTDRRAY